MDSSQRHQDLLHLLDLSPQSHGTCIGIAKSTKQQCRCTVALKSRNKATQILLIMAAGVITVENAKEPMGFVANLLLCKRYHQDQSANLGTLWTEKIRSSLLTYNPVTLSTITETGREEQYLRREDTSTEPQVILDHASASTQTGEQLDGTATLRTRRRRAPDRPLSMILRSTSRANRDSHGKCPICLDAYGPRDKTILLCRDCQNIYHQDCGERWIEEQNRCPIW